MVRACRRQARRLAEGQTTHLVLNMGAVQTPPPPPPSLRAPLLGYSWLLKVLLSAHIMILIGAALHDYLKHLNQAN